MPCYLGPLIFGIVMVWLTNSAFNLCTLTTVVVGIIPVPDVLRGTA